MSGWSYAFSLSKEDVINAEPPGTAKLMQHDLHRTLSGNRGNDDHIVLVPPPSRSPTDPLNWSSIRRYSILATVSYFALVADFAAGCVAPALPLLAFQILPPQPFSELTKLVSVNVLMFGLSNIFWVPLNNIFGRRPILLLSMLIFTFASMWCGLAKSFNSLLAARAVQGLAGTAYSLVPEIVGDVFFVHERGRAMAVYTACLASGPFLGGVSGSYIAGNLGYRYLFWISTALAASSFVLTFFLVPETLFDRETQLQLEGESSAMEEGMHEKAKVSTTERSMQSGSPIEFTYLHSLGFRVYRGNWIRYFVAPWLTLALPGTWVVMLQYGALVGGVVSMATVAPMFLAMPPYLWANNVGLYNLGGLVGVIVGALLVFLTADYLVKWRAKKEMHGFSEPETRLPILAPGIILATTGLWTFGFSAANPSPHAWAGLVVGSGMQAAGLCMVPSIGFNYLIEAYYDVSGDCFVMTTIVRAVVAFAWTYFISEWIQSAGAALPFGIFGMLMAISGLLAVPLWLYGKRSRIATAKYLPKTS